MGHHESAEVPIPGSPRHRGRRPLALAVALTFAGIGIGALLLFLSRPARPWTDDWSPPPGYAEMLADLSAGRADDGERALRALFRAHRSPVWRRRAHLALGVARLRRKEFDRAAEAFHEVQASGGPASFYASIARAQSLVGAGKPAKALAVLEQAGHGPLDPSESDDLAITRARAHAALGDPGQGLSALEMHLSSRRCLDKPRVMEAAARLAEEAHNDAAAADLYRRIYLGEPRSREAGPALEKLSALVPAAKLFRASELPSIASRSRALIAAGNGKGALLTWDLALASLPSAASDPGWRIEIAAAALEARRFDRALALLGPPPVRPGDSERGLLLGRTLFGLGRDREATLSLRAAAMGTGETAGSALFLLATGLDQNDRNREGLEAFLEYIRRFRNGERVPAATWRAAWLSYRAGRRDVSMRLFGDLLTLPGAEAYRPSALYWLGRAHEAAQQDARAAAMYQQLVREHTHDYYGLLAAPRLAALDTALDAARAAASRRGRPGATSRSGAPGGRAGGAADGSPRKPGADASRGALSGAPAGIRGGISDGTLTEGSARASAGASAETPGGTGAGSPGGVSAGTPAPGPAANPQPDAGSGIPDPLGLPGRSFCEPPGGGAAPPRVRAGCEMEMAGLFQDAQREYLAAAAADPRRAIWLRLSEFALHEGDRPLALERLKFAVPDYLAAPIPSLPTRYWELLYPLQERDDIRRFARERSLDPAIICGLILQESAFNPLAVSHAGAVGLMQVLPETGGDAARALGERRYDPARLLEPSMNIRLGTWHLSQLVSRFGGSVQLALAAYNAGETRVSRWQEEFGISDAAGFIEEIPFVETRLYVKRIVSHAAMYRAIYGP